MADEIPITHQEAFVIGRNPKWLDKKLRLKRSISPANGLSTQFSFPR